MLGIRHTLFGKFRDWFEAGAYDPFWTAAERYGVPVMCLANGAPEIFEPIAARHPELTLIIDHFGAYLEREGPPAFAMLDRLLPLARHPNVYVKVTGAPSLSTEPYPFSDLEPFIRAVYEAFGARRLMWGADITRLRGTYSDCVRHFQEGLDFLSDDDRAWILGKTVATALGWPEPDGVSGIP
jgi:predicted TIM-barrel fold metal-dependent hydrolase